MLCYVMLCYYYYFIELIFFMFRHVPECSGMFRVLGFIDARFSCPKILFHRLIGEASLSLEYHFSYESHGAGRNY